MSDEVKNMRIVDYFGLRKTKGDVGIEIEMEARRPLPVDDIPSSWRHTTDGSLRGYSAEYVLRSPVTFRNVPAVLAALRRSIDAAGSEPVHSFRAGVHIHVNVQELTIHQVYLFIGMYFAFEKALIRYCGEDREGNMFCLSSDDAEYLIDVLTRSRRRNYRLDFPGDNVRYASLNVCALRRYGSVEFRSMETMPDLSKIKEWVDMLHCLKTYALTRVNELADIPINMSHFGPEGFARQVFGDELFKLLNYEGFEDDIMDSLREKQLFYFEV